jgi:hypothetical protein
MTVTIELPGEELVEMALRYHSLRQGKTIENYCIEAVLCSLESEGDKTGGIRFTDRMKRQRSKTLKPRSIE